MVVNFKFDDAQTTGPASEMTTEVSLPPRVDHRVELFAPCANRVFVFGIPPSIMNGV